MATTSGTTAARTKIVIVVVAAVAVLGVVIGVIVATSGGGHHSASPKPSASASAPAPAACSENGQEQRISDFLAKVKAGRGQGLVKATKAGQPFLFTHRPGDPYGDTVTDSAPGVAEFYPGQGASGDADKVAASVTLDGLASPGCVKITQVKTDAVDNGGQFDVVFTVTPASGKAVRGEAAGTSAWITRLTWGSGSGE
ncbi:hypothetical protein BIV57_18035 [Mangrovactinospora gilvigrisea]|uniref:Uncharacterized protein n=1 Tax=Mangrovactinospora gilvigrisea TaxID=1428644 RepID=A0A1J7C922_9ACTN|nr:hypothetical protein [Mangrovactinospora gilvigrisea]OIV36138.1 hypothetical protein BIV57_18035 [Mangrovactinospora gilvigrisea]